MKTIEQYKKRFDMLLESSIGDVKPLILEESGVDNFQHLTLKVPIPLGGKMVAPGTATFVMQLPDSFKENPLGKYFTQNKKFPPIEAIYLDGQKISQSIMIGQPSKQGTNLTGTGTFQIPNDKNILNTISKYNTGKSVQNPNSEKSGFKTEGLTIHFKGLTSGAYQSPLTFNVSTYPNQR